MATDCLDQPARGRFVGGEHRLGMRVFYEDTDLSGVVYHANYLKFIERGRSQMLSDAGFDQRAAFERGEGAWTVAELAIRYAAPARLDDALVVASRLTAMRAARLVIHQTVRRDALLLADARVTVAWVTPSGRPTRVPAAWRDRLQAMITTCGGT